MTTTTTDIKYDIIVAHQYPDYGIGQHGKLPWSIKPDMRRFREITTSAPPGRKNAVVMGRKTYASLSSPLPDRYNVVITRGADHPEPGAEHPCVVYSSWTDLEQTLARLDPHRVFIIGGGEIYSLAMEQLPVQRMYITEVFNTSKPAIECNTHFPKYDPLAIMNGNKEQLMIDHVSDFHYDPVSKLHYRYVTYSTMAGHVAPIPYVNPEQQYLGIMMDILTKGIERGDRTGTGTISLFSTTQRYNLQHGFPLSTTKKMFFRAIYEELALYISGRTDNHILQEKGIHIWDGNTSREFLDKRGLTHYPEGDMGETYGFNFRHYGSEYVNCIKDYPDEYGYDQIANLVHLLRTDQTSRRLIINLWNPATQHKAALPACLMMYQFYVNPHAKTLSCQIYLRSSDYFLANSWNACTGALLTHMLCNLEGIDLVPGELIVQTGDTHLYKTHIAQVNENLVRQPFAPCQLVIINNSGEKRKSLSDFKYEDMKLIGYRAHPNIQAPMSV
jgi:dihydrofolate reductase/thymidylate synthase